MKKIHKSTTHTKMKYNQLNTSFKGRPVHNNTTQFIFFTVTTCMIIDLHNRAAARMHMKDVTCTYVGVKI